MNNNSSISPLDDRYKNITKDIKEYFSEFAFCKFRLFVELHYFAKLCKLNLPELQVDNTDFIDNILDNFNYDEYLTIKEYEQKINHDVKAIEYYLQDQFDTYNYNKYSSFIHFGLTSQDINNTAISLSLKYYIQVHYTYKLGNIYKKIKEQSNEWKDIIMLSRTHGQPAVPTTLGKEFTVFYYRLNIQYKILKNSKYYGKFGGASGNLNAHKAAYPNINWIEFGNKFINSLGLIRSKYTTQIDNYDNLSVIFDCLKRINTILIDMCQDIWLYISMDYIKLKINKNEVGSSTMPHKVNPINFENAEGNLKLANTLLEFFSRKLPVSRLQRDLTDSTVLRNIGVVFGHIMVAFDNIENGLNKLDANNEKINQELEDNYVVITEGIQTILRKYGQEDAYEQLKEFSRNNQQITKKNIDNFINSLDVPLSIKKELLTINIANYVGYVYPLL